MALITVQAGPNTREGQVALWERDPRHPDGEVFVVGGGPPVKVAETQLVRERLTRDLLMHAPGSRGERAAESEADGTESASGGPVRGRKE